MRTRSEMMKFLGLLTVVIIVGISLGWLATRNPAARPQASEAKEAQPLSPQPDEDGNTVLSAKTSSRVPDPSLRNEIAKTPLTSKEPMRDMENQISDILGADGSDVEKSKKLIQLFPKLPESEQVEAARHLVNLVSDEDYPALGTILTNSQTSVEVAEILLDDLLNQANPIKVPLILAVARDTSHPQATNAKDLLERILGEDYGTNWNEWERMAKVWLENNPD